MNWENPIETIKNKGQLVERKSKRENAEKCMVPPAEQIGRMLNANIKEIL